MLTTLFICFSSQRCGGYLNLRMHSLSTSSLRMVFIASIPTLSGFFKASTMGFHTGFDINDTLQFFRWFIFGITHPNCTKLFRKQSFLFTSGKYENFRVWVFVPCHLYNKMSLRSKSCKSRILSILDAG